LLLHKILAIPFSKFVDRAVIDHKIQLKGVAAEDAFTRAIFLHSGNLWGGGTALASAKHCGRCL